MMPGTRKKVHTMFRLGQKKVLGTELSNRIIWILGVMFINFLIIGSGILTSLFYTLFYKVFPQDSMSDAMVFVLESYLLTFLPLFIYVFFYTGITKKNRFIHRSFLPGQRGNKPSKLLRGFLAGFLTNAFCVAAALIAGDIKLSLSFSVADIPFYLLAFVFVFIQSSTEELWTRGFLMERVHVHYPLLLAILLNSGLFAALHLGNPGVSALPIINIFIVGVAYSVVAWQTDSIWYAMGAHTAWNFTQNLLFGLPNSGLVSRVSVFSLEAANANDPLVYDPNFGVEGSLPATIINLALTALFLFYAYKEGRLGELLLSREKMEVSAQEAEPVPVEGEL